jgi:hypothetical protein
MCFLSRKLGLNRKAPLPKVIVHNEWSLGTMQLGRWCITNPADERLERLDVVFLDHMDGDYARQALYYHLEGGCGSR